MDGKRGQFLGEDPTYLEIGSMKKENEVTLLSDPQQLNSYSYARNNPLTLKDKSGKCIEDLCIAEIATASYLLARYAPQIISYLQSLTTPLGQAGLSAAIDDAKEGNYEMAVIGGLTSGETNQKQLLNVYNSTNSAGRDLMQGVKNIKVLNLIKDVYRAGAKIGEGSTADAVIHTALTGELVGGSDHIAKAEQTIKRINNIFTKFSTQLNSQEVKILNKISNNLKNAINVAKKLTGTK